MPLFFLLSGYTMHLAKTRRDLKMHMQKNVLHLLGPCVLIGVLSILWNFLNGNNHSLDTLWYLLKKTADAYYWASGVSFHSHPAAGAVWFLFSLFWAKTYMDGVALLFSEKRVGFIYLGTGILGILLGFKGNWIPQNLDVTMVAVLFIYLGMVWKQYEVFFEKHELAICLFSSILWLYCLSLGIYIEMAGRSYPYMSVSVLEALCGTFVICCICKTLAENEIIRDGLGYIGRHTLLIFSVHCVDSSLVCVWGSYGIVVKNILRVGVVLGLSFLFLSLSQFFDRICVRK